MKTPGMMTSSLPRKTMPRTLPPTTTRPQEDSYAVDRRLQKTTGTPATTLIIAAMMAATAAATAAAAKAVATMTLVRLPHTSATSP
jgi:hypothetical protein